MRLNEFRDALSEVAPELLRASESNGLEILLTDGYCQVIIHDPEEEHIIGAADWNDEGGWESALDKAIEWLKSRAK